MGVSIIPGETILILFGAISGAIPRANASTAPPTDEIEGSQLGGMLAMVGGRKALDPLKEPVVKKLRIIIDEFIHENGKNDQANNSSESLIKKIENILDSRLADLTPKDIKDIIQRMIKEHLGWLVVWGGFFGGLLGFILSPVALNLI